MTRLISILALILFSFQAIAASEVADANAALNRARLQLDDGQNHLATAKAQLADSKRHRDTLAKHVQELQKREDASPEESGFLGLTTKKFVDPSLHAELRKYQTELQKVDQAISTAEANITSGTFRLQQAARQANMNGMIEVAKAENKYKELEAQFSRAENLTKSYQGLRVHLKDAKEEASILERTLDQAMLGKYIDTKLSRLAGNFCQAANNKCKQGGVTLNDLMASPTPATPAGGTDGARK